MHKTVFDTPGLRSIMKLAARAFLASMGWRSVYLPARQKKYFAIAAPHTSNWDFPLFISIALTLDIKSYWMGKDSLFRKPYGWFFKWLGGIPIDRSKSTNTVAQFIQYFKENKELVLVNAPEGTRKRVQKWKSGFYHIASGAKVPIALAFLDYKKKIGGVGTMFQPTGDFDTDIIEIKEFYAGVTPKYPEKYSKL